MTAPFGRVVQRALEQRRSDLARVDDTVIKTTRVAGAELVVNAGEVYVEVRFPVLFTERPSMSFGGALDDNQSPETGNGPTVSVVVTAWARAYQERAGGGPGSPGWYAGATLCVVTTGRADHRVWVHWQAEGKAIRDPGLSAPTGTDQTL